MFARVADRREFVPQAPPERDAARDSLRAPTVAEPAAARLAHRLENISTEPPQHGGAPPVQRVVRVKGALVAVASIDAKNPGLATLRAWAGDDVDDDSRDFKTLAAATKASKEAGRAVGKGAKIAGKVAEHTDATKASIDKKIGAAGGLKSHIFDGEFKNGTATGYHSEFKSGTATLATYGTSEVIAKHKVGDVYQQSVHEPKSKTKKQYRSTFFPKEAAEADVLVAVASYLAGVLTVPKGMGYELEGLQMTGVGGATAFPALGKDIAAE